MHMRVLAIVDKADLSRSPTKTQILLGPDKWFQIVHENLNLWS
jgi:hypothetical protein